MWDKKVFKQFENIVGKENFSSDLVDRICSGYDATRERSLPDAVIYPASAREISQVMTLANQCRISVVPRGAGSGFSGGAVPIKGGIVLDMHRMNRIIEIDEDNLLTIVEPGVVTSDLHRAVETRGFFYPPDPASMNFSTIGGNIAENAGGMRAVKYGVTGDYIMGLEVVLPSGKIIKTGSKCMKDVVGYNLTQLFVGSEGTLGIVTKAIIKLLPLPASKKTMTATFPSLRSASETVSAIIKNRIVPATLEFLDRESIQAVEKHIKIGLPDQTEAFLLIELDGHPDGVEKEIEQVGAICKKHRALEVHVAGNEQDRDRLWKARRSVSASLAPLKQIKVSEDIVVPRSKIPLIIDQLEKIGQRHGLLIVGFGHAGDGNIHVNILADQDDMVEMNVEQAVDDIFTAVLELEGCISGEHGIGITKKKYIGRNLEAGALELMKEIKGLIDPHSLLNPGKIFP